MLFLWGLVNHNLHFPHLPENVDDLRARITGADGKITPNKLRRTWEQIYYRWDICRATSISHVEL
jgi:hypothetical protein